MKKLYMETHIGELVPVKVLNRVLIDGILTYDVEVTEATKNRPKGYLDNAFSHHLVNKADRQYGYYIRVINADVEAYVPEGSETRTREWPIKLPLF